METHEKKPKSFLVWLTQTQLGEHFDLTPQEAGQLLVDLGLCIYDSLTCECIPREHALAESFCAFTPSHSGTILYLWHRQKVLPLLQKQLGRKPLSERDMLARVTALSLIQAEKEAEEGRDKAYYLLFDSIAHKQLPLVMAWALLMARRTCDPVYIRLLSSIDPADILAINDELARLHVDFRLSEETLSG